MRSLCICLTLIIAITTSKLAGQAHQDSLYQLISSAPTDTHKVWLYHDLAKAYRMISMDSVAQYMQKALALSRQLDFINGEIASLHRLSYSYQFKGDKPTERKLTIAARDLSIQHHRTRYLASIYNHLGSIYTYELKYDSAYHALVQAEAVHEKNGNPYDSWETKLYFYQLYAAQENFEKAKQSLEAAYRLTKEKGIRMDLGWVLDKRVNLYFQMSDWENYASASEEYLQFLNERETSVQSNFYHRTLSANNGYTNEQIIAILERLIPIHEARHNILSLAESYLVLGHTKREMGDPAGAISAYKKAIPITDKLSRKKVEAELYQFISALYEADGQYAKAYPYLQKYHDTIDSLNSVAVQKNLSELEVKYETAKKDEALAQQQLVLEKTNQSKKMVSILAIGGILLAAVSLWFLYFKSKTNRLLRTQKSTIESALNEKEILLKEIHHRVKNNLQVVSSLLNWQSKYIDDHKALESMQEGRNRVQSMALIHQNLYQTDNLTGIEVADYIEKLGNSLFNSYKVNHDQVQFQSKVEPLNLDVDTLIPLGLILNELLSNALKYAFPEGRKGEILVTLQKQKEQLLLEVKDDGIGIPSEKIKNNKDSFGYRLVEAFAEKLKAQLQIDQSYGTTVRLLIQNFKIV